MEKYKPLEVAIDQEKDSLTLRSEDHCIRYVFADGANPQPALTDFAVWAMLPIGMASGRDLLIKGQGTSKTVKNAQKLSEIWSTWLPGLFKDICVDFEKIVPPPTHIQ